ncbi:MAG: carboxylesterase/lipase family protein [Frankiaceae bacterium]|nr:carboxylesterase/lipase family protein [Frankiaceae bacterium]
MALAQTSHGVLRGEQCDDVTVFRGIPYAAPPVGPRRWRSPAPHSPWSGVRDATGFGPIAPQAISAERLAKRGQTMSEDCLSLNVWTPAADGARRPVVAFIHGGGVVMGSGSAPLLDGAALARRGDLVVVTLNFRLGALGSLYAPRELGIEGDPGTNLALRDQLMALRWIRAEIGGFGGNPADVTLIGQSSGAVAIACLLASPAAIGACDRVILQSGGLERVRSTVAAADVARQFMAAMGDADLMTTSTEQIVAAQGAIPTGFVPPVGPFHHAVDGDLVPDYPLTAGARRPLVPVPMLAGTTKDEWRVFDAVLDDDEFTERFVRERIRALGSGDLSADDVLARYEAEHIDGDPTRRRRAIASALVTDFHFGAPTAQFARDHAAAGNAVFHYELQWPSPRPGLGACHDTCLPLVFGTADRVPGLVGVGADVDRMTEIVQDAWVAFIRGGDPSTPALGTWAPYVGSTPPTMLLGAESRPVVDHRVDQLAPWIGRYPASG